MSKVVLITGGSSGIGKSIGEFLHHKGFAVYGTSRNPDKVVHSIFPLVALDVRDAKSIQLAVAKIIQETGRLDIVINNAGVGITGPLEEIPMEEIKNNFETNIDDPFKKKIAKARGEVDVVKTKINTAMQWGESISKSIKDSLLL